LNYYINAYNIKKINPLLNSKQYGGNLALYKTIFSISHRKEFLSKNTITLN
jgi:hypothetical protein